MFGLFDDHCSAPNILHAPEHGGVSREAPTVRCDVQELPFVTVQPAAENVDRRLFHKMDIQNGLRCFLIDDLKPCRIGKKGQGRTGLEVKPVFGIEGP